MKYTIYINQLVLSETELDILDGAILDYLGFICGTTNTKVEGQRITEKDQRWTWVNLDTIAKQMPILRIKSTGAFTRRIKKIADEGYVETLRRGNQRLYVRLTPKHDKLLIQVNSSQAQAIDTGQQSYCSVSTDKDIIDKENSDKEEAAPKKKSNGKHKKTPGSLQTYPAPSANRLAGGLWLRSLLPEEMAYFKGQFPQYTEDVIKKEAEAAFLWINDNPGKRKGTPGFFFNWLKNSNRDKKRGGTSFHEYK